MAVETISPESIEKVEPAKKMAQDMAGNDGRPHVYHGLEGVVVAETTISTVGIPKYGLSYRGYPVTQLIDSCTFEEVALMLIHGDLPTSEEMAMFKMNIAKGRKLSPEMKLLCESMPMGTHPMDVIRCCVSLKGALCGQSKIVTGELSGDKTSAEFCGELIGLISSCIVYWFNYAVFGNRLFVNNGPDVSTAEHFLRGFCHDLEEECVKTFDASLIAYAEHDLNASTFTARCTASTLSDFYSCILSGIGTLKGPLHGGANEAALKLLKKFDNIEYVNPVLSHMLVRKEKIMGFGHRVYKDGDPRSDIMKSLVQRMIKARTGSREKNEKLFSIANEIEKTMLEKKRIHANLDFYAALVYHVLGIPESIFTVIFTMARVAGWSAHIDEQRNNNKLIRPKSFYVGKNIRDVPK